MKTSCRMIVGATQLAILISCGLAVGQHENSSPNIVVLLCDDLGYGDLECYGHPHIKTPRINELAASGIRLTDFYSAAPVCSPSRVGLLTGRSPNRAGVYDWIPAAGDSPKPDSRDQVHMRAGEVTIPHLLRQAGYATCMSGKWHCNSMFNSPAQPQPSESGFEYWFATQNNAAPSHENPQNYVRNGAEVGDLEGYSCQLATGEALDWMRGHVATNPNQPFFIYLAFHEPHEPVASPEELVAKYREQSRNEDEAQFFANVANVDLAVGRVLDALDDLQLREKTLVVFTSDNGPETLNRYRTANRSYGSPGPLRGMKLWTTDAGFRVAGILSWPGRIQAGQVSNEVVSALDLLPSFCALAGVEPPSDLALDGTDMTPLFDGQRLERARPLVWCYYNAINEQRVAMRHGPWKMLARLDGGALAKSSNIYSGNADEYLSAELTDFELFHISEDQSESRNLYPEANESEALRETLQREYESLINDSHIWD